MTAQGRLCTKLCRSGCRTTKARPAHLCLLSTHMTLPTQRCWTPWDVQHCPSRRTRAQIHHQIIPHQIFGPIHYTRSRAFCKYCRKRILAKLRIKGALEGNVRWQGSNTIPCAASLGGEAGSSSHFDELFHCRKQKQNHRQIKC